MGWKVATAGCVLLLTSVAALGEAQIAVHNDLAARQRFARPAEVPYPPDDPYAPAKAALGKELFFDPIFSASKTLSCGSCHDPARSWGDGKARAHGEGAGPMAFRSPTLLDVAWIDRLGWDGKFHSLESVAFAPITSAANMNLPEATLNERLKATPNYPSEFAGAFDDGQINRKNIERALATFERSIVAPKAPFDLWVEGDDHAISASAQRGFALFDGKANCSQCHSGWNFTDGSFHDIGTATGNDVGRGRLFPTSLKLKYAFKTPTLRDVTRRGPYMHDGSVATLEDVIDLYDKGGIARPSLSEQIKPLGLSPSEKQDLRAFLKSLTGDSGKVVGGLDPQ